MKTLKEYGVNNTPTAEEDYLKGDPLDKSTINGIPVHLFEWVILNGENGEYAILQVEEQGKADIKRTFLIGSDNVLKTLRKLESDRDSIRIDGVEVTFKTHIAKKSGREYWTVE